MAATVKRGDRWTCWLYLPQNVNELDTPNVTSEVPLIASATQQVSDQSKK